MSFLRIFVLAIFCPVLIGCGQRGRSDTTSRCRGVVAKQRSFQQISLELPAVSQRALNGVGAWVLFEDPVFLEMFCLAEGYRSISSEILMDREMDSEDKRPAILAMRGLAVNSYLEFLDKACGAYVSGRLSEDALSMTLSPMGGFPHPILENYQEPKVVALLGRIDANSALPSRFRAVARSIRTGALPRHLRSERP